MKKETGKTILETPLLRRLLAGAITSRRLEARVPEVLGNRRFREELEREMMCSDRTGTALTLLLLGIEPTGDGDGAEGLENLARTVCEGTRKTDRKGWFRDSLGLRVGLILINTAPERTQRIIDTIRESYRKRRVEREESPDGKIYCEIYTYPPYQPGGPNGGGNGRGEHGDDNGHDGSNGNGNGNGHRARIETLERAESDPEPMGNETAARSILPVTAVLDDPAPFWKRALDITGALGMLIVLSPLILLIALAIKLTSPGPVIFKQNRVGYRGRLFPSWKFRSMRQNADPSAHRQYLAALIEQSSQARDEDEEAPMIKLDKVDPRITPIGRLLRFTCLDELPQLINVLRGEMSLVGPRPCLPYEADKYQRWHFQRLNTLPGITGLWQVMGKNKVTFRKMMRLDILYAHQKSFWLDVWILLMTIPAVFREIRDGMTANDKEKGHVSQT